MDHYTKILIVTCIIIGGYQLFIDLIKRKEAKLSKFRIIRGVFFLVYFMILLFGHQYSWKSILFGPFILLAILIHILELFLLDKMKDLKDTEIIKTILFYAFLIMAWIELQ